MKSTAILAALIAALTGAAANAEPKAPPPPASELTAAGSLSRGASRYCLRFEVPGSMIQRRECRTAAQWKMLDVDVLALTKR